MLFVLRLLPIFPHHQQTHLIRVASNITRLHSHLSCTATRVPTIVMDRYMLASVILILITVLGWASYFLFVFKLWKQASMHTDRRGNLESGIIGEDTLSLIGMPVPWLWRPSRGRTPQSGFDMTTGTKTTCRRDLPKPKCAHDHRWKSSPRAEVFVCLLRKD